MNIAYFERQLRAGKTPAELGCEVIGQGCVKAAYKFSDRLIVKENAQGGLAGIAQKNPPAIIKRYGARGPRTYRAGKWLLQELVTPITKLSNAQRAEHQAALERHLLMWSETRLDVHEANCGIAANGDLVVFDW